jgi:beta-N-acetylhexosaminidase
MQKFIYISLFSLFSCDSSGQTPTQHAVTSKMVSVPKLSNNIAQRFYYPDKEDIVKLNEIYHNISLEEKAAQMIMIASSESLGFEYQTYVKPNFDKGYAANILFLKGKTADFSKQEAYLSNSKKETKLLPLYACDCEPSLFHYKFTDQPKMLVTSKLIDSTMIAASLDTIHKVMTQLHIDINFAPVIDLGKNKAIINNRAFSTNVDTMLNMANLFINYTQNDGKVATIKHFPGHGAVVGDTHKGKVWIDGNMTELDNFKNIIKTSSPIFVMVGHISIKNNKEGYNTFNGNPATISRNIVTDLLKKEIGFKGITTTDAMNMGAIKDIPNADFEAVKAGIDLVLMPNNPAKLHAQIVNALQQNDEFSKQLEASIRKIILLKIITGRTLTQ